MMEEDMDAEIGCEDNENLMKDHVGESFLLLTKKKKKRKRKHVSEVLTNYQTLVEVKPVVEETKNEQQHCNGNGDKKQSTNDSDEGWVVPKKMQKKEKKQKQTPSFQCNLEELFSNSGKRAQGTHLKFSDIRNLFMLTVHGNQHPCFPSWCRLNAWYKIQKTVIIMAGCISAEDYLENKECFKYINSTFEQSIPVRNEGADYSIKSPLESFLRYRMSKKLQQKKKMEKESAYSQSPEFYEYILTDDQLRANEFPEWNSAAKEHGVVTTRIDDKRTSPNGNSKLYAIDCEMCNTHGNERVLTRISIVDSNLETVYDELVKPEKVISDYLTQYSGITAEMLENVTTRLADVQKAVLNIIQPDSILVGHSLDFDLRALQLHHDNIIDTSALYVDQRGPRFKSSLKNLVKTYLNRDIQNSGSGHCSIEDAKSCMELVLLKIQKGASFGNPDWETESVFEALHREGKKGALIGSSNIVRQHCYGNIHGVPCSTDGEVVQNAKRFIKEVMFTFAHLRSYEKLIKGDTEVTLEMKQDVFQKVDLFLSQILADIEPSSLVIISLSGGYVPSEIMKLSKDKEQRKTSEVKSAFKRAKNTVSFVKVT